MPLSNQSAEIQRLINAFGAEASKFPELRLSTLLLTQGEAEESRKPATPNHAIMLWQYYGSVGSDQDSQRLFANIQDSDLKWGLRGAALSSIALLEGQGCELFVRIAQRAGSLFDKEEAWTIQSRVVNEILQGEPGSSGKPVGATNDNPLAIWLNYLLYHLSMTHPGRERAHKIEPDPFSLSLLALERLAEDHVVGKVDRSIRRVADIRFKVAMSFPGERRAYVAKVVNALRPALGPDSIFYDHDYQAQLARPNLDTFLQSVYRHQTDLVVVFLSAEYAEKQWCGLEWRAVRDIIKSKDDDRVMFVRFDDAPVDGVLSLDGFVDARLFAVSDVARFIVERIGLLAEG